MNKQLITKAMANHIIVTLDDIAPQAQLHELHGLIFAQGYYTCYCPEARTLLKEWDICTFDAINYVKEYEESNFGRLTTEIQPMDIVSMLAYIIGEEIIVKLLNGVCDVCAPITDHIEAIKEELRGEYL